MRAEECDIMYILMYFQVYLYDLEFLQENYPEDLEYLGITTLVSLFLLSLNSNERDIATRVRRQAA